VEDLRDALRLHRPCGGGRARTAALNLLQKYGFEPREDDNDLSDDEDTPSETESIHDGKESEPQESSFLSAEAMVLTGSLEGDGTADRVDWKDAVSTCKTVSRFAALVTALKTRASPTLEKMAKDKKALSKAIAHWETSGKTRKKAKKNTAPSKKFGSATEIWENVAPTDQFVMCKVEGFPWWPARVCVSKGDETAKALDSLDRVLVSFVGEQHLYVVQKDGEMKPFEQKVEEGDVSTFSAEVIKNVKNVSRDEAFPNAKFLLRFSL